MSSVALEIGIDGFTDHPIRLDQDSLRVAGRTIATTIDISRVALDHGSQLGDYVTKLDQILAKSPFRFRYDLVVRSIAPSVISGPLSSIGWEQVDFRQCQFEQATLSDRLNLRQCVLDDELPAITLTAHDVLRFPPQKAARQIGIVSVRDQMVLRWGLIHHESHLGDAFLWLKPRYPKATAFLNAMLSQPHATRGAIRFRTY